MVRLRLDVALTQQGLADSREQAQALILAGQVLIDGKLAAKPGQLVQDGAQLELRERSPYVSRGGFKLAHALDRFGIDVEARVVVDVGASTGGFTDVLLQRGARRVYAVDVGRGQLNWRLRSDDRVVVLDRTNARYLERLPEQPTLATIDVSFISLRLVVGPVHRLLAPGSSMIVLVKPQFEAGRTEVSRGGVVRSAVAHRRVLASFASWLPTVGLAVRDLTASPIRGPAGNAEFLAWIGPGEHDPAQVQPLVEAALLEVHPDLRRESPAP